MESEVRNDRNVEKMCGTQPESICTYQLTVEKMLTEMSNMDNCFMPHLRFRVFGFHLFWNLMHKRMDTTE